MIYEFLYYCSRPPSFVSSIIGCNYAPSFNSVGRLIETIHYITAIIINKLYNYSIIIFRYCVTGILTTPIHLPERRENWLRALVWRQLRCQIGSKIEDKETELQKDLGKSLLFSCSCIDNCCLDTQDLTLFIYLWLVFASNKGDKYFPISFIAAQAQIFSNPSIMGLLLPP